MLRKISKLSASIIINKINISQKKKPIYTYAFEIIYSTLFCFICMIIFGIWQNKLIQTIEFIILFSILRLFSGGYHASTYRNCFLLTNSVYISEQILCQMILKHGHIQWALCLSSIIYIWIKAPVYSAQRQITSEKYTRDKHKLRICISVIFLTMIFYTYMNIYLFTSGIASILFMVAILIILEEWR